MKHKRNRGDVLRERNKKPDADIRELWNEQRLFEEGELSNDGIFSGALPLLGRLHIGRGGLRLLLLLVIVVLGLASVRAMTGNGDIDQQPKETASTASDGIVNGTSVNSTDPGNVSNTALPAIDNDLEFSILFSSSAVEQDIEVVRVSPPQSDTVYGYNDTVGGVVVNLSQQEIPDSFNAQDIDGSLRDLATGFNAQNVIQIDETLVYHGSSGSNGGTQSLLFVKDGLLIFIASPAQLSDDVWAAYILSLQ